MLTLSGLPAEPRAPPLGAATAGADGVLPATTTGAVLSCGLLVLPAGADASVLPSLSCTHILPPIFHRTDPAAPTTMTAISAFPMPVNCIANSLLIFESASRPRT